MKKLLCLLPIIVLIIGCGGEAVFYPLTVGNHWVYQTTVTTITQIDTVTADTTTALGETDNEITAETTLDNGTAVFEVLALVTWEDTLMPDQTDTVYLEETEDYILQYEDKADTDPDTAMVLPIEDGNTWTVHSDTSSTTTAVVLDQRDVQVPAGTYNECWRIAFITDDDTVYTYFAEDVGNVMSTFTMEDSLISVERITELESATIN